MKMEFKNQTNWDQPIVIALTEGNELSKHSAAEHIDETSWQILINAAKMQDFKPKACRTLLAHGVNGPILVVGVDKSLTQAAWHNFGSCIYTAIQAWNSTSVTVWVNDRSAQETLWATEGTGLRNFHFDQYKTKNKKERILNSITWIHSEADHIAQKWPHIEARIAGNHLTRTVVSEPPNVIYPESMAQKTIEELKDLGVEITILDRCEMQKKGMNALLGVAQGSIFEPRLIVLKWNKAANKPLTAIVGKGVTFDSGGISIKPSNNMEDMKYDMAGSGVVLGLFKTLALRKAEANVVGIMAMVENMPSGTAQRPADVVTSMSGQTIEVVNTDAEGRLILADALWYVQETYKPKTIIDLATLTGAVTVALGYEYAGIMSNSDTLCEQLCAVGEQVQEPLWRLPLNDAFDREIDSDIADMKNVGSGRGAGTLTAAHFLKRFIQDGVKWAHLDIAGMAWDKKNKPLSGKGATGFGVRLIDSWLDENGHGE